METEFVRRWRCRLGGGGLTETPWPTRRLVVNRAMPEALSDVALARALLQNDPAQLSAFVQRFGDRLGSAFGAMCSDLQRSDPPGCAQPFDNLTPHVGNRSGAGFLHPKKNEQKTNEAAEQHVKNLAEHVARLMLQDLFLVAAGLLRDPAAAKAIFELTAKVATCVSRKFDPPWREIVQDAGPGHLWATADSAGDDGCSFPRLASYTGVATLRAWTFAAMYNLGRDYARATRTTVTIGPRVADGDREHGHEPEAPPAMAPGQMSFAELSFEELTLTLEHAIDKLKNGNSRRHQVAYLWLYCRFRPADIAGILSITRPAVSQHVSATKENLREATAPICEVIAAKVEKSSALIQGLLDQAVETDPGRFFEPILFHLISDAFRQLGQERPDLLRVAMLLWKKKLPVAKVAGRMAESPQRVAFLLLELADWRHRSVWAVAEKLSSDCGVAANTLVGWIDPLFPKWLGEV